MFIKIPEDSQIDTKKVPPEIKEIFERHREALVICVDPVANSIETEVGAFVKMLDKDKGGKLASILDSILSNLRMTYGQKCGYQPDSSTTSP